MKTIKCCIVILIILLIAPVVIAQVYPGESWQITDDPDELGFNLKKLEKAKNYSDSISTAALVIVKSGIIVYEWGEVDKKYMTHSIRKSFLSALYGNYVRKGIVDLDKTVEELGLDDEPPLSDMEKKATLRDCLKARSGIYHDALYESERMKAPATIQMHVYMEAIGTDICGGWHVITINSLTCRVLNCPKGLILQEALEDTI